MSRYFFAGRDEEVIAYPELRSGLLGEVMRERSKRIGWIRVSKWYQPIAGSNRSSTRVSSDRRRS